MFEIKYINNIMKYEENEKNDEIKDLDDMKIKIF
jgi:hypothetical protein